jgi:hypothetical protein
MDSMRARCDRDVSARIDQELRRRLHLAQSLHRGFGECEECAGLKILLAKLNELDAVSGPAAHLDLQPIDLYSVYETRCSAIRDCTTEHPTSLAGLRYAWLGVRVGL